MIPGQVSRMSEDVVVAAATIQPLTDIVRISGATAIANIMPAMGPCQLLVLIPTGAGVNTTTTGNIATAVTLNANVATLFIYSKVLGKWVPGALA